MNGLFDCAGGNGFIYRLNPSVKILLAFAAGMAAFAVRSISGALFIAALTVAAAALSGLGRKALSMALLLVKISALLLVIQLLCVQSGETFFSVGPVRVTDEGLRFSLLMAAKLIAASLPLMLALSATKRGDLANSLVQNCRLPYRYAFALTATLKFIPTLAAEMAQVMEAQRARRGLRGAQPHQKSRPHRAALPAAPALLRPQDRKQRRRRPAARLRTAPPRQRI